METEKLNKILETIKTLNLTFDGNFNSQTLSEIVNVLAPYYKLYLLMQVVNSVLFVIVCIGSIKIVGGIIKSFLKKAEN